MLPTREWTEDYVLTLPVQEYDEIEFKAPQWLDLSTSDAINKTCNGLAKELSALANTGGGKLVIGLKDPKQCKSGVLEIVDGGVPVLMDKRDTAEWLRAIVPTLLDYPVTGFEVHPILPNGPASQIAADKALFVIDLPDSEVAPHQSKRDNKYYMRVGGNSLPIGHRTVMDIVGRQKFPVLELRFCIRGSFGEMTRRTEHQPRSRVFALHVTACNTGKLFAQYVNVILSLPPALVPDASIWVEKQVVEDDEVFCKEHLTNTRRDVIAGEGQHAQLGPSWFDPILPGRERTWTIALAEAFPRTDWTHENVRWVLFADNAPVRSGSVAVKDISRATEWDQRCCPCCSANAIGGHQWDCDCDRSMTRRAPFICSQCGCCTGVHCTCAQALDTYLQYD